MTMKMMVLHSMVVVDVADAVVDAAVVAPIDVVAVVAFGVAVVRFE